MKKPAKNKYEVVVLTSNTCGSDSSIELPPTKRKGKKAAAGSGVEKIAQTYCFKEDNLKVTINGEDMKDTLPETRGLPATAAEIAAQINAQCPGVHAEVKVVKPIEKGKG